MDQLPQIVLVRVCAEIESELRQTLLCTNLTVKIFGIFKWRDFKGCWDLKFFLVVVEQELTKREVEYVALSRDTTETDLKQRREIRSGTAFYIDQVAFLWIYTQLNGRDINASSWWCTPMIDM